MYCPICNKNTFKTSQALKRHTEAKHSSNSNNNQQTPRRKNPRQSRRNQARLQVTGPMMPNSGLTNRAFFLAPTNTGKTIRSMVPSRIPTNLGTTFEGSTWARRALHPNDDTVGGGIPIPDLSESQSANFELRHTKILSNPTDGSGNWDVQFVCLPFSDVGLAYRYKLSNSTDGWGFWVLLEANQVDARAGRFKLESGSTPYQSTRTPGLCESASAVRQSFRGVTIHQNSNAISNQGIVTAGQWGAKPEPQPMRPSKNPADTTEAPTITHQVINSIPVDSTGIIYACPEAGQWESKLGVYMPMRFVDPTHLYSPTLGDVSNTANVGYVSGTPVVLKDAVPEGNPDQFNYANSLIYVSQTDTQAFSTAARINQNLGVIIFEGLDPTTNLAIKMRTGVEVVASTGSPYASFTQNAITLDDTALKVVQVMSSRMAIVYEAKYNSLGFMLPLIQALAPTVLRMVGGLASRYLSPRTQSKRVIQDIPVD